LIKILLFFFVIFQYAAGFASVASANNYRDKIIVFFNGECDNCVAVQEFVLLPFLNRKNLQYEIFDISFADSYSLFLEIEKFTGDTVNFETPIVLFNNKLFAGKEELTKLFPEELDYCEKNGIDGFFKNDLMSFAAPSKPDSNHLFDLVYFYKKGCADCSRIENDLRLLKKIRTGLNVLSYDIAETYSVMLYESLSEKYKIPERDRLIVPAVFVKTEHLTGNELNYHSIEKSLLKFQNQTFKFEEEDVFNQTAGLSLLKRFEKFSAGPVMLSGLIDGINPCAFSVIIFFLSYALVLKKEKKIILISGLSFIFGIFLCYFLIGTGLLEFLDHIRVLKKTEKYFYFIFSIAMFALSGLNFYDFVLCVSGNSDKIITRLPLAQKLKINDFIKKSGGSKMMILSMFLCGIVISFYEFGCTGQIYLPTLIFVSKYSELYVSPFLYLFLYNLMFIVPLLIILAAVYKGVQIKFVLRFFNKRIAFTKLLAALLFLGFALMALKYANVL